MTAQDFTTSQHFCDSAALLPLHSWLPALLKPHVPFRGTRGQPDGKSLSKRKHGSKRCLTTNYLGSKGPQFPCSGRCPESPLPFAITAAAAFFYVSGPSTRTFQALRAPVSLSPQRIPGGPVSKALRPTLSLLQPGVQQTQLPPAQLQSPHLWDSGPGGCRFPPQLWLLGRPHSLRRRARSHAPWGPQLELVGLAPVPLATRYTDANPGSARDVLQQSG